MSTAALVNNQANTTTDTIQTFYTADASGDGVIIDSFTASNTSNVNASYSAYITSVTDIDEPQIPFKVVVWGENDLGIGAVNHVIPPGGKLKMESSAIDSIYFTVTGRIL